MLLWSTTHVAPLFMCGSHGNTSTKLWLVQQSGESGGKGRIRNARAAGWDRPRGCTRAEEKQLLHTYYMRLAKPLWRGRWTAHVAIINPETSHCLFGAFWKRWRAISTGQGSWAVLPSLPPSESLGKLCSSGVMGSSIPSQQQSVPLAAAKEQPGSHTCVCPAGMEGRMLTLMWEAHAEHQQQGARTEPLHHPQSQEELGVLSSSTHGATRQSHAPARISLKHSR